MKIQYTGKARAKVEGIGTFEPGGEAEVLDSVGKELCRGGEFREVGSQKPKAQRKKDRPDGTDGADTPPLPGRSLL